MALPSHADMRVTECVCFIFKVATNFFKVVTGSPPPLRFYLYNFLMEFSVVSFKYTFISDVSCKRKSAMSKNTFLKLK